MSFETGSNELFFVFSEWILPIEPKIAVQLIQLYEDLVSLLWCEAWQLCKYFGFAHKKILVYLLILNQ